MNFISVNLNGVSDPKKGFWIRGLKRSLAADFVGLQETHVAGLDEVAVGRFWDNTVFKSESVDSVGRSGGLLSIWNPTVLSVDSVSKNQRYLLISGFYRGVSDRLNIVNIHAPNDVGRRRDLWVDLAEVISQNSGLWILLGDFNEVRSAEERINSRLDGGASDAFNGFISNTGLLEYSMSGGKFTFISGHFEIKMSKLDRFLVNDAFMSNWPCARVVVHKRGLSDHCPISLSCSVADFGPIPFKFFNSWIGEPKLTEIVNNAVSSASGVRDRDVDLASILKQIKWEIKKWRKDVNFNNNKQLAHMVAVIEEIEAKAAIGPISNKDKEKRAELRVQVKYAETIKAKDLQQKARVNWLKFGDENSAFFHRMISINTARNRINGLQFNNRFVTDPDELKEEVRCWFKKQFAEPIRRRPDFSSEGLPSLSEQNGAILCDRFSEKEILLAIRSCHGGKAPGPDGFSMKFFNSFWSSFKEILMGVFNEFFSNGKISNGCNSSFVALIPKVKDPQLISEFRPISLVGSIYKIIAKVLANRLKLVISDISSPVQSAFVGGRNILDSPMIVGETVAWAKKSKVKLLVFKVDFAKAYDSLNWKFLLRLMEKMNFPSKWVMWIKGCLASGMGSVLVNGSPSKEFKYKRGLRQGDPLSPFLFILATEVITLFINRAVQQGLFKGVQLPNGGPLITHLCYADDVVFLGLWSEENVMALNRLLRWIFLVTGLKVNRRKCNIFGIGVEESEVDRVAKFVNCEVGAFPFSYLGIPIGVNMKREKFWKAIIDRFASRLSRWKARHLSFAGRMTLAKSVLGALPAYFLSLFAAPKGVIKKLEKIRREFLWGKTSAGHKLRWVRWSLLLKAKKLGGMGVGSIQSFNQAMLIKWWWRLKSNPNHLWAKVVTAIHGGNSNGGAASIIPLKKCIPGFWKAIGSVDSEMSKIGLVLKDNLMTDGARWKWRNDPDGTFSVKQVRSDIEKITLNDDGEASPFRWNNWAIPKANMLLWRACMGKVASKMGLIRRGIPVAESTCDRCGLQDEDPDHIFLNCLWARCVWWNILAWMRISFRECSNLKDFVDLILQNPGSGVWKKIVYTIVLATVWRLWSARNEKVFNNNFVAISKTVDLIKEDTFLWINTRSKLKASNWEDWKLFDVLKML
ncbi:putative RNA-directed DNA polymerase [Helianthus annuus]|nr:putative RNA-directed DNA polymerase [Helianthus annuus]